MDTEEALILASLANPLDETAKLVLADWLEDHDKPDCAAFMRCLAERMKLHPKLRPTMEGELGAMAGKPEVKAWLRFVCELNEKYRRQEMPF